ncbi:MAG: S8 family serine peptidase [Bacteroidetes bacterium]|nr:S8 family serine peptidase [Bacteroidota bacterium]
MMNRCFVSLSALLLLTLLITAPAHAQTLRTKNRTAALPSRGEPGRILVKVTPEAFAGHVTIATFGETGAHFDAYDVHPWIEPKLLELGNGSYKVSIADSRIASLERIMVVRYSSNERPEDVAAAFGRLPGVEYAEPDYPRYPLSLPNDPGIGLQWYLDSIRAKQAWELDRADSTIIIAITDTGIERYHEDIEKSIWINPGEMGQGPNGDMSSDGIDNDGNGYVDDWWGYDFSGSNGENPDNDPSAASEEHGTETAGVAAGIGNNGVGIAGVAFGARIMNVKVADDRPIPETQIHNGALGVLYAAKMKAKVINCSWGGTDISRSERELFEYVTQDLHVLVVAAAGNDNREVDYFPASYKGVVSVASITEGNLKASFSNYSNRVDLSAPGTNIYTLSFGSYRFDEGTSFSAPMVSGVAALLYKKFPGMTSDQVAEALRATADDMTPWMGSIAAKMGTGRVNAYRALTEASTVASARMLRYDVSETVPDGGLDPGENVVFTPTIANLLAGTTNVHIDVECTTVPDLMVAPSQLDIGPMTSGEERALTGTPFRFTVPNSVAPNTDIVLKFTISTSDRSNVQYVTLPGAPTYLTTDYNRIAATFNSTGNIGHDGVDQQRGDGVTYRTSGDLLFHGGLMIGKDAEHVSDVVRIGGLFNGTAEGFELKNPYRLHVTQDSSAQIGLARFDDAHVPAERRVGLDVAMTTYEYRDSASANCVIVVYRITNTSGAKLDGLRCGLYLDWDVSPTSYNDQTGFDPAHRLGYQRNTGLNASTPWVGASLLGTLPMSYYAVDNETDSVNTNFTSERKWGTLAGDVHENNTIDDMAMVVGGGPFSLENGAWTEVAFALLAAPTFDSLRAAADHAATLFHASGVALPGLEADREVIASTMPNPFAGLLTFQTAMRTGGDVSITLYDLLGRPVRAQRWKALAAGAHSLAVQTGGLAPGTYLYEVSCNGAVARGKVLHQNP